MLGRLPQTLSAGLSPGTLVATLELGIRYHSRESNNTAAKEAKTRKVINIFVRLTFTTRTDLKIRNNFTFSNLLFCVGAHRQWRALASCLAQICERDGPASCEALSTTAVKFTGQTVLATVTQTL